MAADDLDKPLGTAGPGRRKLKLPLRLLAPALAGLSAAILAVFIAWVALIENPLGGEPVAVVAIERSQNRAKATAPQAPPTVVTDAKGAVSSNAPPATAQAGPQPAQPPSSGPLLIKVPQSGEGGSAALSRAVDPSLVEDSKHGPIPKIAADGRRPSEMFAATTIAEAEDKRPKIAVLVGGLGISRDQTSSVLERLPRAVTLGFAPYGDSLEGWTAKARENGHEIMLEVPMEPFDYPNNDPGPQTLLTSLPANANLDRLAWSMSRLNGYFGMTSFMGQKFTQSEESLAPVLTEAARRGLVFLDNLAAPRSPIAGMGPETGASVARADLVIDAVPNAQAIDAALARLEEEARRTGAVIGVASGLPVTVERLEHWAGQLTGKGIALVPVSAVVKRNNPS